MEVPGPVEAAVQRVTTHAEFSKTFKHPLHFDGTNFVERRLSAEEQRKEVAKVASTALHVFLERYGGLLLAEDLRALSSSPAGGTPEVRFWIERFLEAPPSSAFHQKRSRRRRWVWAKGEMARADGFFSEEEMKRRDPELFHRIVGRHLPAGVQLSAPMQGSLSCYLMQQLEKDCQSSSGSHVNAAHGSSDGGCTGQVSIGTSQGTVISSDQPRSSCTATQVPSALSESEEDADMSEGEVDCGAPDDVTVKRARFFKTMRDRFVDGQEPGFRYATLDEDSELDDIVELGRDAEERYFDED